MKATQKLTLVALLALMAAAVVGLYLTSGQAPSQSASKAATGSNAERLSLNRGYLDTIRYLASTSTTLEEQMAAKDALDAADHDLDLQYASALQLAAAEPAPQTPEVRAIQERIAKIEAAIVTRQTGVEQIKNALGRVQGARRDALQDQLDVSQAELNLFQEALSDAKDDLIQEGGDAQSRLQTLKAEHVAASEAVDTFKFPPVQATPSLGSLLARWYYWKSIGGKQIQIENAQQEALKAIAGLAQQHDAMAKRLAAEQAERKAMEGRELTPAQIAELIATPRNEQPPAGKPAAAPKPAAPPPLGKPAAANQPNSAITLIRQLSSDQVMAHLLGLRIQSMNGLVSTYSKWDDMLALDGRTALHSLIAGGLWILVLMIFAFFLNRLIERFFTRVSLELKQKITLQTVVRTCVRVVIVVVILLMIFGKPNQLSTVLGLAGAGLAVVMQGFIVSFFGWFVLMGRHGLRVGDWVEINGVRGEVIEISLLRTVLLETGNWTDIGQPTGRKVAFMNQFAVSGTYFNFSTSGQWLWDELQVSIPAGQNPYPLVEKIRAIVATETESNAQLAEREWQRVSNRYTMKVLSAKLAVNLKPTDNGLIAVVRYITRAEERTATRYRLNREIVKLFHHGEELVPEAQAIGSGGPPASDSR